MLIFLAIVLVLILAGIAAVYVHDVNQTQHTILRNFPVLGHFRYFAETWGEYMRQYQYLPDWLERPFNRIERTWIYRSAKNVSSYISFGSEASPSFAFRNAAFPLLEEDCKPYSGRQIGIGGGPGSCTKPFFAQSFFNVSGMSYGALSHAAVASLSRGAKMAGVWMGTGEGGLSSHHLDGGADIVFQIGTAKYGVRDAQGNLDETLLRAIAAHECVRMFEVKLAQGAKPGKGGLLPGVKVTEEIAVIRGIPAGRDSISPNRHRDIGNIRELGDFIGLVRQITGKPVGVKFVVGDEDELDDWFADCLARPECCPDYVHVDGGEGGTGAAPAALAEAVGMPITLALPLVVSARERHGLGERIRIVAAGKLVTPDKVAWALSVGADFVVSARGFMFALGCIQAMKCGSGKCPTGVTAVDPKLIRGLDPTDKAVRVMHYANNLRAEVAMIAHACGVPGPEHLQSRHVTEIERGITGFRNTAAE